MSNTKPTPAESPKISIKQIESDIKQFDNQISIFQSNIPKILQEIDKFEASKLEFEKKLNSFPSDTPPKKLKMLHHEIRLCNDAIQSRKNKLQKYDENIKVIEANKQRYNKFLADYEVYQNKISVKNEQKNIQQAKTPTPSPTPKIEPQPVTENTAKEQKKKHEKKSTLNSTHKKESIIDVEITTPITPKSIQSKEDEDNSACFEPIFFNSDNPDTPKKNIKISIVDAYIERSVAIFNNISPHNEF